MNMCPSLVEIRSVTSEIRRRKNKKKTVKYKPFEVRHRVAVRLYIRPYIDNIILKYTTSGTRNI